MAPAWPFLISRNQTVDYTTVVLPSFMDLDANAWLVRSVDSEGGDAIRSSCVEDLRTGPLFLLYRVTTAKEGDVVYRDGAMRPILWVEGVALRGARVQVADEQRVIESAHHAVAEHFRAFWDGARGPKRSAPFDIELKGDTNAREPQRSPAPPPPSLLPRSARSEELQSPRAPRQPPTPRRPTWPLFVAVAMVLGLLALAVHWRYSAERRELFAAIVRQAGHRTAPRRAAIILLPSANGSNLVKRAATLAGPHQKLAVSVLAVAPAGLQASDSSSSKRPFPAELARETLEEMALDRKLAVLLVADDRCLAVREFRDDELDDGDVARYLSSME
jgi:hypothetical protein